MAEYNRPKKRSRMAQLVAAAVAVALGAGLWILSQNIAGVMRTAPPTPTVNLLPPPPPLPPQPPPKEPPPPPENKPMEAPKPDDKPDTAPRNLTINGPAQAGGDAFGIAAGSGGGSTVGGSGSGGGPAGGGFEEASYARFLSGEIQQAIQSNSRIDQMFSTADVAIWIGRDGRVTHARIRRSTGNDRIDQELIATLERMRPLSELPPAQFQFPREIKVRGTRG